MANVRSADPFALMLNPQAVLQAMEQSERLQRLQRRVYRPLDRPIIPRVPKDTASAVIGHDEFDDEDDPLDE